LGRLSRFRLRVRIKPKKLLLKVHRQQANKREHG
jgi:hypothetical protein